MNGKFLCVLALAFAAARAAAAPEMIIDGDSTGWSSADRAATPLALATSFFSIPDSRGWDVYGIRLNLCIPGWTGGQVDLYGVDAGLSGEFHGDAAGILCNLLDNRCDDFAGLQVGGFYNRIAGDAPFALQATLGHNRANTINGVQIGLVWNEAKRLNGLQIGLFNAASEGAGLQIGLWNTCADRASPILGFIF